MIRLLCLPTLLLLSVPASRGQFDHYFRNEALRLELSFTGHATEERVTLDRMVREPVWPESRATLLDPFSNGRHAVTVREAGSGKVIYWRGFDLMFGEYRTTTPAIEGVRRTFPRSVRIPFPRGPVTVSIDSRDRQNILQPVLTVAIDPTDFHIAAEPPPAGDLVYEKTVTGDPGSRVDVVYLAEGYTLEDSGKFRGDVDRLTERLFGVEPFRRFKDKFNIRGIHRPSTDRGTDEPRHGSFRRTAYNSSFDALDLDRYLLTEEGRVIRSVAAQVPYDAIVILVNSARYGGGGLYNDYCITTVDNVAAPMVFVHEFGHSFAGLADEYYAADVAYNDFYPKGVEPLEPNITALMDVSAIKWKDLLTPGVALPTEYGKALLDSLQAERRTLDAEMTAEQARIPEGDEKGRSAVAERFRERRLAVESHMREVRERYRHLEDAVGAFEGAGYTSQGLYRPMMYCLMIGGPRGEFCRVCQRAIERMIQYYGGEALP